MNIEADRLPEARKEKHTLAEKEEEAEKIQDEALDEVTGGLYEAQGKKIKTAKKEAYL